MRTLHEMIHIIKVFASVTKYVHWVLKTKEMTYEANILGVNSSFIFTCYVKTFKLYHERVT